MYWIYDLPEWLLGLLFVGVFVGVAVVGVVLSRPAVRKSFAAQEGWREHVSITLEAAFVFVGLLLALITLAAYDNFADARAKVATEASEVGTLDRDVSAYPQPQRGEFEADLRRYVARVIESDWPKQRRGVVPKGEPLPGRIQHELATFEPAAPGEDALHGATLAQVNAWLKARRERMDVVIRGLPSVLWVVLVLGALVNIALTWLLPVEETKAHVVLSAAFAFVIALLLFVTASMDHPFRGNFSVSPEAFRVLQDDVFASTSATTP